MTETININSITRETHPEFYDNQYNQRMHPQNKLDIEVKVRNLYEMHGKLQAVSVDVDTFNLVRIPRPTVAYDTTNDGKGNGIQYFHFANDVVLFKRYNKELGKVELFMQPSDAQKAHQPLADERANEIGIDLD